MIKVKKEVPLAGQPSIAEGLTIQLATMDEETRGRFLMLRLPDLQRELEHEAKKPGMSETGVELWTYDAAIVKATEDILRIMCVEQWRQREAIKLYLAGQIDRGSLRDISNSWNKGPATEPR